METITVALYIGILIIILSGIALWLITGKFTSEGELRYVKCERCGKRSNRTPVDGHPDHEYICDSGHVTDI